MASPSPLFAIEAQDLLSQGRVDDAIQLCRSGLALYPDYPTAYKVLADALILAGDPDSANEKLNDALLRMPGDSQLQRIRQQMKERQAAQGVRQSDADLRQPSDDAIQPTAQGVESESAASGAKGDSTGVDGEANAEAAAPVPATLASTDSTARPASEVDETSLTDSDESSEPFDADLSDGNQREEAAATDNSTKELAGKGDPQPDSGNADADQEPIDAEPDHASEEHGGEPAARSAEPLITDEQHDSTEAAIADEVHPGDSIAAELPQNAAIDEGQEQGKATDAPDTLSSVSPTDGLEKNQMPGAAEASAKPVAETRVPTDGSAANPVTAAPAPEQPQRDVAPVHLRIIETAPALAESRTPWRSKNLRLIPGLEFTSLRFEGHAGRSYERVHSLPDPPAFPEFEYESVMRQEHSMPLSGRLRTGRRDATAPKRSKRTPLEELSRQLRAFKPKADPPAAANVDHDQSLPRPETGAAPAAALGNPSMVTETIAKIYVMQGAIDEAIAAYQTLAKNHPGKAAYFQQRIDELREKDS